MRSFGYLYRITPVCLGLFFILYLTGRLKSKDFINPKDYLKKVNEPEFFISGIENDPLDVTKESLYDSYLNLYEIIQSRFYSKIEIVDQDNYSTNGVQFIPKNIIQTSKNGKPSSASEMFMKKGESFKYIVTDDEENLNIVKKHMTKEVIDAYEALPLPILKADFFRYIAVFISGGIYSDIDTEALKDLDSWLPVDSSPKTLSYDKNLEQSKGSINERIGLIVGVEGDLGDKGDFYKHFARRIQLCQWTFVAKPGHPALKMVIDTIAKNNNHYLSKSIRSNNYDIMNWTGPGVFTDVIINYITAMAEKQGIENWNFERLIGLQDSLLIGDVLVLPITSFNPGVGFMGSKPVSDPMAFIHHKYEGSWKND